MGGLALSVSTLGDATILDKPLISAAFFVGWNPL